MMIPRCEDVLALDVQQTRKLSQHRALVIIGVTKTQVNSISLVIQLRMSGTRLPDKIRDAIHLFLAFGGKPFKAVGIEDETRLGLVRGKIYELRQDRMSRRKQFGMIACASIVPNTERFPLIAVFSPPENVPFSCQNEVRTDRQREFRHTLF